MGTSLRARPLSWTSAHRTKQLPARAGGFSTHGLSTRDLSTRRTTRWFASHFAPNELNPSVEQADASRAVNDDGRTDIASVPFEIDAELREMVLGWNALRSEHPDRVATNAFRLRENVLLLRLTIEALLTVADGKGPR